jgi:hypothetical protein
LYRLPSLEFVKLSQAFTVYPRSAEYSRRWNQEKNGWKARYHVASAIVPPRPLPGEASRALEMQPQAVAPTETPEAKPVPLQPSSQSPGAVYKGGTPGVPELNTYLKRVQPLSILCTPLVHNIRLALDRLGMLGMAGMRA